MHVTFFESKNSHIYVFLNKQFDTFGFHDDFHPVWILLMRAYIPSLTILFKSSFCCKVALSHEICTRTRINNFHSMEYHIRFLHFICIIVVSFRNVGFGLNRVSAFVRDKKTWLYHRDGKFTKRSVLKPRKLEFFDKIQNSLLGLELRSWTFSCQKNSAIELQRTTESFRKFFLCRLGLCNK